MNCRSTGRRRPRANVARGAVVATVVGLLGAGVSGLGGLAASPAGATSPTSPSSSTSTTAPGAAPNQSQINADQAQVTTVENTLAQEEQQSAVLDDRYDTAIQNQQDAEAALTTISANLDRTKSAVTVNRRRVANDAIKAYVYGTPQTRFTSLFTTSAELGNARDQYAQAIVGDLNQAQKALQSSETQLTGQEVQQQNLESQAQSQADQVKELAQSNQQEAAATQATLSQVKGQLAQEVTEAAVAEAQQEAAAAAKASDAAQAQQATAAAQSAATVAAVVGGPTAGNSAIAAANQAANSGGSTPAAAGGSGSGSGAGSGSSSAPVSGSDSGSGSGSAAVSAAESQLGVSYVFGGDSPSTGFDCSGLVQWAWAQAGVSIPRTTETQWASLPHVSLNALEPGDLLYYFDLDGDNEVDHVVMYVGSDTVVQAPETGGTVSYSPIWSAGLIGAARP